MRCYRDMEHFQEEKQLNWQITNRLTLFLHVPHPFAFLSFLRVMKWLHCSAVIETIIVEEEVTGHTACSQHALGARLIELAEAKVQSIFSGVWLWHQWINSALTLISLESGAGIYLLLYTGRAVFTMRCGDLGFLQRRRKQNEWLDIKARQTLSKDLK